MPEQLPKIYLYRVGGEWIDGTGYALAEDGTALASHISTTTLWTQTDLGLLGPSVHDTAYHGHYPNGYVLEWVDDPENHPGLQSALAKNRTLAGDGEKQPVGPTSAERIAELKKIKAWFHQWGQKDVEMLLAILDDQERRLQALEEQKGEKL